MQIRFKESSLDLSNGAALLGVIELDPTEPFDAKKVQHQAKEFIECGAVGIELGIRKYSGSQSAVSNDNEPISKSAFEQQANVETTQLKNEALTNSEQAESLTNLEQAETLKNSAQNDVNASKSSSAALNLATLQSTGTSLADHPCPCIEDSYTKAFFALTVEQRADLLVQACHAIREIDQSVLLAVYTYEPLIMEKTVAAGVQLVIDPRALREPGALETVSSLKVNVCLCFDQTYRFTDEDKIDICGHISEFFYERIDACINAKIARNRIMLDPTLSPVVGVDHRIKLQGRLKSFNSFALPLSCEIPRVFPGSDEFLSNNMSVTVAVAIFVAQQGFHIIRTKHVYDLGLALDTWQALSYSARPFKIRSLLGKKFKALASRRSK